MLSPVLLEVQSISLVIPCIFRDKNKSDRIKLLNEWQQNGGVLIIGYEMFRTSTSPKKENLEMRKLLLNPGADLVVCDEGHLLKNDKSNLAKRMQSVRTQRRIILTGTPLQNNLKECKLLRIFIGLTRRIGVHLNNFCS